MCVIVVAHSLGAPAAKATKTMAQPAGKGKAFTLAVRAALQSARASTHAASGLAKNARFDDVCRT